VAERDTDTDIDALLGDTFARVGESPKAAAAATQLQAQIAAARPPAPAPIDPRTLPVRFTRLKAFALSAAHYQLACQGDVNETIALRIGAGFHAELFRNRPVVCWPDRRQGKAWERFERHHRELGAVVLNEAEYRTEIAMVAAVKRHPRAMELLFDGTRTEQSIDWTLGDRACHSTPDAFHAAGDHQAELKSTRCAEPRWLAREALRRFYHAQTAFYDQPIERVTGRTPGEDRIVAVENVPPYNVTVLRLTDEVRELGAKLVHKWFEQLRGAELCNYYGGYVEADVDLELPSFESREPVTVEIDGQLVTID
jgi:PDDEXK-like uncharacterized protein DUF3799